MIRIISETPFMEAALAYSKLGLFVFPLLENTKQPMFKGGHHIASSDEAQISQWWSKSPRANIGLNLEKSGLVAVDLDLRKDGFDTELPWVPQTWTQHTARDGIHYIFQDGGQSYYGQLTLNGKVQFGVDIKHNGYIVLAPSVFEGGRYLAENTGEPAPAPKWLTDGAAKKTPRNRPQSYEQTVPEVSQVADHLSWLNPDLEYSKWLRVLMSVHDATRGSEAGLRLAIDWSRKGEKFGDNEAEEIRQKWRGFKLGGGVTYKTLKLWAACARAGVPT